MVMESELLQILICCLSYK